MDLSIFNKDLITLIKEFVGILYVEYSCLGFSICFRSYENDKIHGDYKSFDKNNNLLYHVQYKYGKRHGFEKLYTINKKLYWHYKYKDGKRYGRCIRYYYDTLIISDIYHFYNDKLHGYYKHFNLDGKLCLKYYYDMNTLLWINDKIN